MQCRDVEEVLEQEGLTPLPEVVRGHVAGCRYCQGYIADLETIVSAAQELPAEVEPPSRVWVALRTQLELEGVIKEAATAVPEAKPVSWWHGLGQRFGGRGRQKNRPPPLARISACPLCSRALRKGRFRPGEESGPGLLPALGIAAFAARWPNLGERQARRPPAHRRCPLGIARE